MITGAGGRWKANGLANKKIRAGQQVSCGDVTIDVIA
jgi:hypothetical protein